MGHNDDRLDAALGRKLQGLCQFVVENQIRRHNMYVVSGCIDDIEVHQLSHGLLIQGTVAVRDHEALHGQLRRIEKFRIPQIPSVILRLLLRNIPHLEKHHGKAGDRVALHHDAGILPVAETHLPVDILIRQVNAARKCRVPVDHQDLSVVPVILVGGQGRSDRREHLGL